MTAAESNRTFLLDTSAVMALIEDEEVGDRVEALLRTETVFLPFLVGLETYYVTLQERSEDEADYRWSLIRQLPAAWLNQATDEVVLTAARLKARHRISLADAIIAGFALERGATLVHKDPEFETIRSVLPQELLPYKTPKQ